LGDLNPIEELMESITVIDLLAVITLKIFFWKEIP